MDFLEIIERPRGVKEIFLNRPQIHNAFNDQLIEEMILVFESLKDERLIILSGRGKSFCAGADLHWMKSMIDYSEEENFNDSKKLAKMFEVINQCPIPVIGRVHGHALGGGVGLLAVCDYVIAAQKAKFGFTEVRLGLIPAVISPYCLAKIGESQARKWMLSGEKFSANEGKEMGLIHHVCESDEMDHYLEKIITSFLQAAPNAAKEAKKLIRGVVGSSVGRPNGSLEHYQKLTCAMISERRVSEEGQEGMRALLEKTQPKWMNS